MQVSLKLQHGLPSLRSPALKAYVEQAIDAGHERFGMRLLSHTLEKDGLSFVVTAPNRRALSRGIQGISVRIARAVNRQLERKGRLFADRYEARLVAAGGAANGAGSSVSASVSASASSASARRAKKAPGSRVRAKSSRVKSAATGAGAATIAPATTSRAKAPAAPRAARRKIAARGKITPARKSTARRKLSAS